VSSSSLRAINLGLRFVIELCLLAAFAYWGSRVSDSTAVNVAVAIAAPLAAAAIWGLWIAPKSQRRLPEPRRFALELVLFGLAAAALIDAGRNWGGAAGLMGAFVGNRAGLRSSGDTDA
jgi:hypothetical protein